MRNLIFYRINLSIAGLSIIDLSIIDLFIVGLLIVELSIVNLFYNKFRSVSAHFFLLEILCFFLE